MRERPILFSSPMVRALLAGTKTQTRRVVKPAPSDAQWIEEREGGFFVCADGQPTCYTGVWQTNEYAHVAPIRCPYGQPGDRLWVREAWKYARWTEDGDPFIGYQADNSRALIEHGIPEEWGDRLMDIWADLSREENFRIDNEAADRRWRPSIHMPRWASRITLEITDVRVERLQSISEEDAIAEGLSQGVGCWWNAGEEYMASPTPKGAYALLWNQINGPGSWDANPWVWCVSFRRVDVPRSMGGTA